MHGRGTLLVFCVFSISLSYCVIETSDLDLGGSTVSATAECGRNANGDPAETEFCTSASTCESCNVNESENSYPARAAIDGAAATSWQSPPLSEGEEFRAVNFTLELGQRYTVTSITLRSGASPLPAVWVLHGSQDGVAFTPWRVFGVGNAPEGREVMVDLSQDSPQAVATHILLELQQPRAVQDENDPRQQFYSISELSVVGVCAEATGCTECGYCLEQLIVRITNLTELVNTTLIEVPIRTIFVNMTTINTLQENITGVQSDVEHLEGTLLVLEVAVGTQDGIPDNTTLPTSVVRLDLELVPPLLQKLQQLRQLVNRAQEFTFDTDTVAAILDALQPILREASNNASTLNNSVTEFLSDLDRLLQQLRNNLNETTTARMEASLIHMTIHSRLYDNVTRNLNMVAGDANTVLLMGQRFSVLAEINGREAMDISAGLERVEMGLSDVVELARGALDEAAEAQNNSQRVTQLIMEIQDLLSMAESLNGSVGMTVEEIRQLVESGEQLLQRARDLTEEAGTSLSTLTSLISMLSMEVEQYRTSLTPYRIPPSCNTTACTAGQRHADNLFRNASEITNSSVTIYTVQYARDFLARLNLTGQLFDYSSINQTALRAQDISMEALRTLDTVDLSLLLNTTSLSLSEAQALVNRSANILTQANATAVQVNATVERYKGLYSDFRELQNSAEGISRDVENLRSQTGLRDTADQLYTTSTTARNLTITVGGLVEVIEEGVGEVRRRVQGTAENIERADGVLDEVEQGFLNIRTFLDATRETAESLAVNISNFLEENDRIIRNISMIISNLEDMHSLINRINSPVRTAEENGVAPYLSLQPPPGRRITDTIQFESLNLFFWRSAQYVAPALLFYAGPVHFPGSDGDNGNSTVAVREDYFLLTAEISETRLQWQLGEYSGMLSVSERVGDFTQIYITRVGSQFELRLNPSAMFEIPAQESVVQNNSLLFRTSNRTSFLLGGWPEGAQLGLPSSPISLSSYNPFLGQFHLFLFNGQQWGLWNIRGASRSDFIGNNEFQMSPTLVNPNTWHALTTVAASAISFNGNGYLKVEQLANFLNFNAARRQLTIYTRPNDESNGLVLYAYDTMLQVSLEIAYRAGSLFLIIRRHDISTVLVNYTIARASGQREVNTAVFFRSQGFRITDRGSSVTTDIRTPQALFFNNLQRVQAWIGGVRQDMLESPYVPEISNGSYFGCIDMDLESFGASAIFTGTFFEEVYLNSPIQRDFSATCLNTIYASEVGLDGGANTYLSYPFLYVVDIPNLDRNRLPDTISLRVLTLTFFPVDPTGIIMAAQNGESRVYVVMRNGALEVGLKQGGGTATLLRSDGDVAIGEWHYLLIEFNSPSDGNYILYLDGLEQQSVQGPPGFSIQLQTRDSTVAPQPMLFVGGIDSGVEGFQELQALSTFRGCLKDFGYNYRAMSFLNQFQTLSRRYLPGISYYSCPFMNASRDPILAVRPDELTDRTCLEPPPTRLQNTHGGFHRDTQLNTSNVLGLFARSWTLSMLLKYTEDGHVVGVGSQLGHQISLSVQGGRIMVSLEGPNGTQGAVTHTQQLEKNVFTDVSVTCEVGEVMLSCSVSVEGSSSLMAQVPYSPTLFFPTLPLVFGRTTNSSGSYVESFVGCLDGLAINEDPSGFADPEVTTDVPCYNNTEAGVGFTGISVLGELLPPVNSSRNNSIPVTFRANRQNGLLLFLTHDSDPVFAVGIFNGEVRISNFSSPEEFEILSMPETVCDADTHNLVVTYSDTSIGISIDSNTPLVFAPSPSVPILEGLGLTLTLGNTPGDFVIPPGSQLFSFLLSEDVDQNRLPPGFVGCIVDRRVQVGLVAEADNLQNGFCPASD